MYKLVITTTSKKTGDILTHSEVNYPTYAETMKHYINILLYYNKLNYKIDASRNFATITLNKSVLKNIYILEVE